MRGRRRLKRRSTRSRRRSHRRRYCCTPTRPSQAKPFTVEADASDFAIGAVHSQLDSAGVEAYFSRKLAAAEINYEMYDKELLAIVAAFEQWRHYLAGAQHKVTVHRDHKNLKYFSTSRTLNRRQARWSIFLADFDFEIVYRLGADQGKADALSRRSVHELTPTDEVNVQQTRSQLRPDHFRVASGQLVRSSASLSHELRDDIVAATKGDSFTNSLRRLLDMPARSAARARVSRWPAEQGRPLVRPSQVSRRGPRDVPRRPPCRPFWGGPNPRARVAQLLVAAPRLGRQGARQVVRHLRALQDESAPPLRPPPAHARPRPTLGVPVHRLYH
jgi:hypothetical protein